MLFTSRIALSVLLAVAIGLTMTSWPDGLLAQQRPSELRLDMKAAGGEDKPDKAAAPKPPTGTSRPYLSICGKPVAPTSNTNACDFQKCSKAEADHKCAAEKETADHKTFASLVSNSLDAEFGFDPTSRTDAQRKNIKALEDLDRAADNLESERPNMVDSIKTSRDALDQLRNKAIATGGIGPLDDTKLAILDKAHETGTAPYDVEAGAESMIVAEKRFAALLTHLKKAATDYLSTANSLRNRLDAPEVKTAREVWARAALDKAAAAKTMTEQCQPCPTGPVGPTGPKPITITSATFGSKHVNCDGKDFVDLKCSRTPVVYSLCRTSANNPTIKLCSGTAGAPGNGEISVSETITADARTENLVRDTCRVVVTAKGICGTATQAMMSAAQVNEGEIKYKCAGDPNLKSTGPQFEGKTVILDCRPAGG